MDGLFRPRVTSETSTPNSKQILRSMSTLSDVGFFLRARTSSQILTRIQLGAEGKPPSSDMYRFPNGPPRPSLLSYLLLGPRNPSLHGLLCREPAFSLQPVVRRIQRFAVLLELLLVETDRRAPNSSLAEWRFELHARR